MKRNIVQLFFLLYFTNVSAKTAGDSTLYRSRQANNLKYVILPEGLKSNAATITTVTLQRKLFLAPEKIDLEVEIYNVLYKNHLAVFSVMPSYKYVKPTWVKINLDTIKARNLDIATLQDTLKNKIKNPSKANGFGKNLKFAEYALIIKKADGWYCNTTDCFTEFFEIIDDSSRSINWSYQINLSAPTISVAEYESAYRRKDGGYSSNIKIYSGYNEDVAKGDRLNLSFVEQYNNQKKYHFWLLSEWAHDGRSAHRGTDRFVFQTGVGIVSASYDFFMPAMVEYWHNWYFKKWKVKQDLKNVVLAGNEGITYSSLDLYFTEYTIPEKKVIK